MKNNQTTHPLHQFAQKYYTLYTSPSTTEPEVEEHFADECFALNFQMDCGESIERIFRGRRVLYDVSSFAEVVGEIDDVYVLGSAIFSKYRDITHWSEYSGLLSRDNREWFKLAFRRLMELAEEKETE